MALQELKDQIQEDKAAQARPPFSLSLEWSFQVEPEKEAPPVPPVQVAAETQIQARLLLRFVFS